jgi:hypothetical protein
MESLAETQSRKEIFHEFHEWGHELHEYKSIRICR